ncbi:MAG: hypothetical protein HN904_08530 [Victivallales bacterium]|jgi:hypothetical protein|nr:hypothetical protein [Victivallales bacterium]MBT7162809.1 hypothetical protein [Victivallales bacterium]
MKRVATGITLLFLVAGLLGSTASGADLGGGVHLRVGGRYLQLDIATTAPIIVYDGVYYQQTVETTSMLVPVTMDVPQTSAVMVPPYASEILINGVGYPLEPERRARTIEVVTGTVQKTVYEPQAVETTVYVPTDRTTVTGSVYFVSRTSRTGWVQVGGVTVHKGKRHPHYKNCKPPTSVVVVDGVWRYRDGHKTVPLRRAPVRKPVVVKPGHRDPVIKVQPSKSRRRYPWW